MTYTIVWEITAVTALRRLRQIDPLGAKALRESIDKLSVDPEPNESAPLGSSGLWRLHVGTFRAIYQLDNESITIRVINIERLPGPG
jgi:mRNA interferase RelE/StbE